MKYHFVYLLQSLQDSSWYIGFTENLETRLKEHNTGGNTSTKSKAPYELIYFEGYLNKLDALGREKFLKSGGGRRFLKKQLNKYLFGATKPPPPKWRNPIALTTIGFGGITSLEWYIRSGSATPDI